MRLSPAQIATIEFQNDGATDSLTSTLAPARFFQLLEREGAIAERSGSALMLLSITLNLERYLEAVERASTTSDLRVSTGQAGRKQTSEYSIGGEGRFSPAAAVAKIERHIIAISEALSSQLRTGDFFSRYSDTGFLMVIRGSHLEFHLAQERFQEFIASTSLSLGFKGIWEIDSLIRERGEEWLHLVERVDRIHF